jgi:hypothetical protein
MNAVTSRVGNFLLFQIGWWACVWSAAHGHALTGAAVGLALVALHWWAGGARAEESRLLLAAGVIGTVWDSAVRKLGLIEYPGHATDSLLAPLWITAMWMLFATTLNASLSMLLTRPWLAALAGLVAAPASYYAGARLGALQFATPATALLAQALGWAVMLPLLLRLASRAQDLRPRQALEVSP